ncbi:MAG TPA: AAA family ATPase [Polyangium sp.]|nr:AAA family ATPase [Polyangium sp.]
MFLQTLRLRNLRCLSDTGSIPIKPLTVLVGRNSAGKSTFLRAFPLLRQSVETARSSPILWYRPQYIDFGSFHDAVNDRASERDITFEFQLTLPQDAKIAIGDPSFRVAMTLSNGGTQRGVHVSVYEIHAEGHEIRLDFDPSARAKRFVVNGRDMLTPGGFWLGGKTHLLPPLQTLPNPSVAYQPVTQPLAKIRYQNGADGVLLAKLVEATSGLFRKNTGEESRINVADAMLFGLRSQMHEQLKSLSTHGTFRERVDSLELGDEHSEYIIDHAVARLIPYIIEASDQVLADLMSRVAYVAPKRAAAERAYRLQDLAVTDVDPSGDNLAMFLHSLSPDESESLADFTRSWLDFSPKMHVEGMHAGILVTEAGATSPRNIVDIGFGYAEVLPVAAAVWSACVRSPKPGARPNSLIAIEQPELHLHPAFQAKLAAMFTGALQASRKRGNETNIIIETHSEALISKLGQLVHEGKIDENDVQLVVFDRDPETLGTQVTLAKYDEEGALRNWPYGFFLYDND